MTKIILPFIILAGMLSGGNATNCYDFKKPTECENTSGCRWVDRYDHNSPPGQAWHGYCDFWIRSQKTKRSLETDSDYDNEGVDVERINSNNQDLLAEYKDETDCFDFLTESECTSRRPRCRWFYSAGCGPSLAGPRGRGLRRIVSLETENYHEVSQVEQINSNNQDLSAEYGHEEIELPNEAVDDSDSSLPRNKNKYFRTRGVQPGNGSSGAGGGQLSSSGGWNE